MGNDAYVVDGFWFKQGKSTGKMVNISLFKNWIMSHNSHSNKMAKRVFFFFKLINEAHLMKECCRCDRSMNVEHIIN